MRQPQVTVMSTQHATHNVLLNDLGLLNQAEFPEQLTMDMRIGSVEGGHIVAAPHRSPSCVETSVDRKLGCCAVSETS